MRKREFQALDVRYLHSSGMLRSGDCSCLPTF